MAETEEKNTENPVEEDTGNERKTKIPQESQPHPEENAETELITSEIDADKNHSIHTPRVINGGIEKDTPDKENDRNENNTVTVELTGNQNNHQSPEIVVEPKLVERLTSAKQVRDKFVLPPKSYPVTPEKIKTPTHIPQKQFFKCFLRIVLRILLTFIVFGYAIGGAYLFSHLEKDREIKYNAKIDKWKNDTAILLATELRQVTPYEDVWARKVFHYLEIYEKDLLKASALGYRRQDDEDREERWTWTSSLFFSISLMTTTGYGSMTPRSKFGRIAAIFYSLFGIPLAFSWFMTIGYYLAFVWTTLFKKVCCRLCNEDTQSNTFTKEKHSKRLANIRSNSIVPIEEQTLIGQPNRALCKSAKRRRNMFPTEYDGETYYQPNEKTEVANNLASHSTFQTDRCGEWDIYRTIDFVMAVIYASLLYVVYYVIGSVHLSQMKGWALLDGFYFNYLMLLTLGPGCHELEADSPEIALKSNFGYSLYLCLGYSILAMIANLIYMLIRRRCNCKQSRKLEVLQANGVQLDRY